MRIGRTLLFLAGMAIAATAQSAGTITAPPAPAAPGVYLLVSAAPTAPNPWLKIDSAGPYKINSKHSELSSMTDEAVPAPTQAEFIGAHAQVTTNTAQPFLCAYQVNTNSGPLLVKLQSKKNQRVLDMGTVRATLIGGSRMVDSRDSPVVQLNEAPRGDGCDLIEPSEPLKPGDYALMFGTENMTVYAFRVPAKGK
jgi:hypothetical protein